MREPKMDLAVRSLVPSSSSTSTEPRGRQTKVTPEKVAQIVNLVQQGKCGENIVELIGATVATLQEERTTEIPLTPDTIRQLAIEAWLLDMKMVEVVSEVVIGVIKGDLFHPVIDQTQS